MDFDEFRISIQPDIGRPGHWSVLVRQCPLEPLTGFSSGSSPPKVTRADLDALRNSTAPPDLARLKQLGQAVLETIMGGTVAWDSTFPPGWPRKVDGASGWWSR